MGRLVRVRTRNQNGRDEMDGVEEVGCELVAAGGDAAGDLQSAEHALGGSRSW
jgi:hypothetical protein